MAAKTQRTKLQDTDHEKDTRARLNADIGEICRQSISPEDRQTYA
jgi:hypothetical protein